MKIQAAVAYPGETEFKVETVTLEQPKDDEILIEIAGVGICHTDIFARDLAAVLFNDPAVLGHEGAGTVVAVGERVSKVAVGDRVAVTFRSCGSCGNCERGPAAYCEDFQVLNMSGKRVDGSTGLTGETGQLAGNFFGQSSFATHCLTYERNVVKVPESIPLELAGPLGCGIQTGAGAILNSLNAEPGTAVMICGGGPVGQSAVMAAKIRGCRTIILVEPQASRRDFALEHGATHAIDPAAGDVKVAVKEIVPEGLEYAFDTTGIESVIADAAACLKNRGALGLVGLSHVDASLPVKINRLAGAGVRLIGILEGDSEPDQFIPELMDLHLAGKLPFDKMITTYPFEDINRAIAEQHAGECIKAVLIP